MKDVARSSVLVPELDKQLKKAGGHIGKSVVGIKKDEDDILNTVNDKK